MCTDQSRKKPGRGGALTLWGENGSPGLRVFVTPMRCDNEGFSFADHICGAMFISDQCVEPSVSADLLRQFFGLTKTEASLAATLVQGLTLSESANARGVSVNTARTQIKEIFAKTGTHSQVELLRLIMTSPAGWLMPNTFDG